MHELSITQSILDISLRHAEQQDAERIIDIRIVIGQLSSFIDEAIQMYWDIISEGTIALGAKLHFRRIPAVIQCRECRNTYQADSRNFNCPQCGGFWGEVVTGDEFYVESIDVIQGGSDEQETNSGY